LRFVRLEPDPDVAAAAVREVIAACEAYGGPAPDGALERLGDWLLRPLGNGFDRLAICANDILAYLPFEALTVDGIALADRCVVWAVPSATTVVRFGDRSRDCAPTRDFAGFAVSRPTGLSGSTELSGLPAAAREVRAAAALFPARSIALADQDATVGAVRANAPGTRYVHFATHGVINDGRPLYSGLLLAPSRDGAQFLHAYEIFALDLCAEVVVCSACETAVGESRTGEGIVGLSYAFFAAGARSVVLSRWPVNDHVTKRLMVAFYRELARGTSVAMALRVAVLQTRERYHHPHTWAGFLLLDTTVRRSR
jgi:CHAT domain-containing protein